MLNEQSRTIPALAAGEPQSTDSALVAGTFSLIDEIQSRLKAGESLNNPLLTEMADRHFGGSRTTGRYTPRDAYDALEVAVNRLLLTGNANDLMSMGASDALTNHLRPLVGQLPTQADRTAEQTELQQFSSPPTLAYLAARVLNPQATDIVLEPSAGTGSLAIWPRSIGARVLCNEINARRRELLTAVLHFDTYDVDGEIIDDLLPSSVAPTAVLMNPPFSATGGRVAQHRTMYGARHIESALRRLQEGGRLVAIVGEGMSLERPAFSEWWQRIARLYNVRANFHLSGREYGKYGTTFGNQIIVIDKDGVTPGDNWQQQLSSIRWGAADTLNDAWKALEEIAPRRLMADDAGDDAEEESNALYLRQVEGRESAPGADRRVCINGRSSAARHYL